MIQRRTKLPQLHVGSIHLSFIFLFRKRESEYNYTDSSSEMSSIAESTESIKLLLSMNSSSSGDALQQLSPFSESADSSSGQSCIYYFTIAIHRKHGDRQSAMQINEFNYIGLIILICKQNF